MNFLKSVLFLFFGCLFFQNCATLISRSVYPFTIEANPSDANILVINSKGKEIFNGPSPAKLALRSGAGYFKKASYTVTISRKGFENQSFPIKYVFDTWYIGNILISPFWGFLVIDPLTGAMYKLNDDFVKIKLEKSLANNTSQELKIYDLSKLPEEWKKNLVKITP